jgi:hypothetical protein
MLPDQLSESDLNKYFIGDSRDFASIQDIYRCLILVCFFDTFIVAPINFRCGNFLLVLGGQILARVTNLR